jgi:hypothetical protein
MALEVERYFDWSPNFKNEIWITDKRKKDNFIMTLKEGEDIEIEFYWDYGYQGAGSEIMRIPIQMLKDLISELEHKTKT